MIGEPLVARGVVRVAEEENNIESREEGRGQADVDLLEPRALACGWANACLAGLCLAVSASVALLLPLTDRLESASHRLHFGLLAAKTEHFVRSLHTRPACCGGSGLARVSRPAISPRSRRLCDRERLLLHRLVYRRAVLRFENQE